MIKKLSEEEINSAMEGLRGWTRSGDEIGKTFQFADFDTAMQFVNRVAEMAKAADHHPDIDIRFNKVKIALSTHTAGGLTAKDTHVAHQIEAVETPNL